MALRYRLASWIKQQPLLGRISWEAARRLPFLLPHDESYYGFRHFAKPEGGLFLDLGANNGITALGIHRLLPRYRIVSIEANPRHRRALDGVRRRVPGFEYRIAAASDEEGEITLYVPKVGGVTNTTPATTDPDYLRTVLSRAYGASRAEAAELVPEKVRAIRLDSLGLAPDLMKIDIEGHELPALRGFEETLRRSRPVILFEFTPGYSEEVAGFLAGLGYRFAVYTRESETFADFDHRSMTDAWNADLAQVNVFCIPEG